MLTQISIENFKGIRDRVDLDLRPLTLFFGPNSSGKSTLFHALHYAKEVICRGNLDPDQTVSGGVLEDLGGFRNLVHGHEIDRPITIALTTDTLGVEENPFADMSSAVDEIIEQLIEGGTESRQFEGFAKCKTATVEFTVRWSHQRGNPVLSEIKLLLDGHLTASATSSLDSRRHLLTLHSKSPAWYSLDHYETLYPDHEWEDDEAKWTRPLVLYCLEELSDVLVGESRLTSDIQVSDSGDYSFYLTASLQHLFRSGELLSFATRDELSDDEDDEERVRTARTLLSDLTSALSRVFGISLASICNELEEYVHLGPIRELPPREYQPPRFSDAQRWASGLAAWDYLHVADQEFIDTVNVWLSSADCLDSGYRIERLKTVMLDQSSDLFQSMIRDESVEGEQLRELMLSANRTALSIKPEKHGIRLQPSDVGVGLSQVIPIIVACLRYDPVVTLEQPELHLHPRLAAELGDLLIEGATGIHAERVLLVETQSEHLILRLQRRLRENAAIARRREPSDDICNEIVWRREILLAEDVRVYYVSESGGSTTYSVVRLSEEGRFIDNWPDDFFEIDFKERFADDL